MSIWQLLSNPRTIFWLLTKNRWVVRLLLPFAGESNLESAPPLIPPKTFAPAGCGNSCPFCLEVPDPPRASALLRISGHRLRSKDRTLLHSSLIARRDRSRG